MHPLIDAPTARHAQSISPAQPWEDPERILRHGEKTRTANDPARAHTFFARVVELNPNDARGWLGLAQTAPTLDEAIICWGYTLALTPDNLDARAELDARIEDKLNSSGTTDAPVLIALGRTLAQVGSQPAAYRLLAHATALNPLNVEGWIWRAAVAPNPADTVECLNHALALDPENIKARAGLKWATAQQTPHPASPTAAQATALCADGIRALADGDTARAYELFQRATNADPQNETAWFWSSHAAPTTDQALECIARVLAINPQHQAAKDAQWWLRTRQLREQHPTHPTPLYAPDTETDRDDAPASPKRRAWLIRAITFLVLVAIIALAIVIALRLTH